MQGSISSSRARRRGGGEGGGGDEATASMATSAAGLTWTRDVVSAVNVDGWSAGRRCQPCIL